MELRALRLENLWRTGRLPECLLEWPERFLPRAIEELFVGVTRLRLIGGVGTQPCGDLSAQGGIECRMVEQDVLESGGEVDLCGANLWEAMEEILGER